MTETAVWVYAVARPPAQTPIVNGVAGESVRLVRRDRLVAAVGSVSLDEYGEEALRRNLEDLSWLESRARLHHQVVSALAVSGPVVPMRLAIMYDDDERVQQMLAETQREIEDALAAVSGCSEWGVKGYASDAGVTEAEPGPAPGSGTAYLQRKRDDLAARDRARKSNAAKAESVYRAARSLAVAGRRHALQDRQLSGESREMLLNAAFLVEDERSHEFAADMASLGGTVQGVDIQLTGPWPPYSFTFAAESP